MQQSTTFVAIVVVLDVILFGGMILRVIEILSILYLYWFLFPEVIVNGVSQGIIGIKEIVSLIEGSTIKAASNNTGDLNLHSD